MLAAAATLDGPAKRSLVREIARSMVSALMGHVCVNRTTLELIARPEGAKTTAPGKVPAVAPRITNVFARTAIPEKTAKKRYLVLTTVLAMVSVQW